jgi:hypothetical protein
MSRDHLLQVTLASTRWSITLTFAMALIFSIFSVITICTCSWLCFTQLRQIKIKHTILRETLFRPYLVLRELSQKITLRVTPQMICLIWRELAQKLIRISTLEASCTRLLGLTTLPLSILTQVFASELIPFNTDSSFWVCDNSATGHICNNKYLFSGEMVPLIYIGGAATGTAEPTLMGMVVLRTTDNSGKKHVILTHINYIPNSAVNLLSTRVLSKQYVDENGFDKQGTGVWSAYDTHVLIWDHGRYSKQSRCILLAYLNVFSTQVILA